MIEFCIVGDVGHWVSAKHVHMFRLQGFRVERPVSSAWYEYGNIACNIRIVCMRLYYRIPLRMTKVAAVRFSRVGALAFRPCFSAHSTD